MAEPPRPGSAEVPSPIEATLRILQSSVPNLIGVAVVRQGIGAGSVVAEVGRVPWVFDRRLTQLELSDAGLLPNQPVILDWPVPREAGWVGVPPRLLIARLVAFEKTAGVLLGTLMTREQLEPRAREAIELSCQLIASAVATESLVRESEREARRLRVLDELQRALSSSLDARALGRVLRETTASVMEHVAFAVSLFHPQREEVAYRYRVADTDALASELGRQPLDDGPDCRAARLGERITSAFEIEVPTGDEPAGRQRRQLSVAQFPLLVNEAPIGVVTVQAFRADGFLAEELELAQAIVDASANHFAQARRLVLREPHPEEPRFTLVTGAGSVAPAPSEATPAAGMEEVSEPEPREPAPLPGTGERDTEKVARELLAACAALGQPHAFVLLGDEGSGLLRATARSDAPFMDKLDEAIGLARGTFVIGVDDRSNAIARACREGRIVSVAWIYEILQPIVTWQDALVLERLAGGGRCTVIPIQVEDDVAGALVVGPTPEELSEARLERLVALAEAAAGELAALRPSTPRELGPTA